METALHTKEELISLGQDLQKKSEDETFWIEQLIKIRDRDGNFVNLAANAAQKAFQEKRTQQNIILKARQMGMTTWIAASFFLRTITRPGTLTVQVAHTQASVEAIFRTVQRMWEHLPDALRDGPLKRSRANVGQMAFPALDSEFRVWSAADINAGRGLSIQNLHCSEVSRWPGNAFDTLGGLRAALVPGGELVLESTPNGALGAFYDEWQAGVLTQHFLPWWMEPAYIGSPIAKEKWTEAEQALVQAHNLTPQQIGYRRYLQRHYGKLRTQEFAEDAETCFRATGNCCFEIEAIEKRISELPGDFKTHRNGALRVWLPREANRQYLVAVDTAGGTEDGDFAAIQIIDLVTGAQCAELQQRLRPQDLARAAAELAREYNNALLVVERNNHGGSVLAYLDSAEHYDNLYKQKEEDGWLNNSASRPVIIAHLNVMLAEHPELFRSRRLLAECRTFVTDKHGKMAAAGGKHDDLVLAMAIAQSVRNERLPKLGLRNRNPLHGEHKDLVRHEAFC